MLTEPLCRWVKTDLGGPDAILEPHESIEGMLKILHRLTSEDNGKFYNYDGTEQPW